MSVDRYMNPNRFNLIKNIEQYLKTRHTYLWGISLGRIRQMAPLVH